MVIPPGAGCQGSPPADGSGCGTPASTADNARPAWSTRGRRSRQSRPVASDWFSASTAATSSWSRLRTCPDRVLLRSSGARSASSSQRRTRSLSAASTAGSQRDNQEDEQRPANGAQPLGLGGSWRASSRRRGWGRRRAGTLGRGRGRRRRTGPGRSRRRRGRHAGVGRVPERSVVGRVAESSPSPARNRGAQGPGPGRARPETLPYLPDGQGPMLPAAGPCLWSRVGFAATASTRHPHRRPPPDRPGQAGEPRPAGDTGRSLARIRLRHHPKRVRIRSRAEHAHLPAAGLLARLTVLEPGGAGRSTTRKLGRAGLTG